MTEEQKDALIDYCKEVQGNNPESSVAYKVISVALAALTAQPDDWEQRAEATEVKVSRLDRESQNLSSQLGQCDRERRAALAKLAEMANKKPDIMVSSEGAEAIRSIMNREMSAAGRYVTLKRPSGIGEEGMMGIYIRPAPAADLADLVPDESDLADRHIAWLNTLQRPMFSDEDWEELTLYTWLAFRDSFRINRAAILRNIEEANKK